MERTNFKFDFTKAGLPLIKLLVDGKIYANHRCTRDGSISIDCELKDGKHVIEIVHYGKNYSTDTDTHFELQKLYINEVDIKQELFNFIQYPDIPPWDNWHVDNHPLEWKNNLYLGHNGKLMYNEFITPSIPWFHKRFSNIHQPQGMRSNKEFLQEMKKDFANETDR